MTTSNVKANNESKEWNAQMDKDADVLSVIAKEALESEGIVYSDDDEW